MNNELLPHLFRTEFGKIVSVLTKYFSLNNLDAAEDLASETFLLAMETWPYEGTPENPTAWLYAVAKNKAKNFLHRSKIFNEKVQPAISGKTQPAPAADPDLSTHNIKDSQLQMLFTLCHPSIAAESQVALCLRILCGFGIDEIASAFLTNRETIIKRIQRAKEKLREQQLPVEMPAAGQLLARLDSVIATLYLLFSEGYYSETNEVVLREDFCGEAMRLLHMLADTDRLNTPSVHAALALMYFHASRFKARMNSSGALILYDEQDRELWNHDFISKGAYYLNLASRGSKLTKYHLEAGIAYWHTVDAQDKWENILQLYNKLLQLEYSPIAALNRTYALSKANGEADAIKEAENLHLTNSPYYFALLGELYRNTNPGRAAENFRLALNKAKSTADRNLIQQKIQSLMN
jgi:RNA polymerase sigma factor (sigma-70 family)